MKAGHGQKEDTATRGVGHIHIPYDHYNFSKGIGDWLEKHEEYRQKEASSRQRAWQGAAEGVFFWGWHGAQTCDEVMVCQDALPAFDQVCASLFFEVGIPRWLSGACLLSFANEV